METQLHLLDTAPLVTGDRAPRSEGHPGSERHGATASGSTRPGSTQAGWRLSAETRATGRRGVAQARAALQSAHRAA